MIKLFKNDYRLQGMLLLIFTFMVMSVIGCESLTPKKQLAMMYSTYNSQYAQYMTDTGWMMDDDGSWLKVDDPILTENQKVMLRKKKEILTTMYPLVKTYDTLITGMPIFINEKELTQAERTALMDKTEPALMSLLDQLSTLSL